MPSPTQRRGYAAEDLVAARLRKRGFELLARNVRSAGGEIDIVAYDGPVLCFIEVRARRSAYQGDPILTVGPKKRRLLVRAAQGFVVARRLEGPMRFDVVSVQFTEGCPPRVHHVENAFDVDGAPPFW